MQSSSRFADVRGPTFFSHSQIGTLPSLFFTQFLRFRRSNFFSYVFFKYTYAKYYRITGNQQSWPGKLILTTVFLPPLAFHFCVLVILPLHLGSFFPYLFFCLGQFALSLNCVFSAFSISSETRTSILPAFSNVESDITYAQPKARSLFSLILFPLSHRFLFSVPFTIKSFLGGLF